VVPGTHSYVRRSRVRALAQLASGRWCQLLAGLGLFLTASAWHVEANAAQFQMTWVDSSTNEAGFAIERAVGTTGTFAEIGTTGSNITSYTDYVDTGLAAATTYCYRVQAFNEAGSSDYSNMACGTTLQTFGLAVVRGGTGNGTVTSSPAGINCGMTCSATLPSGTAITLTATPAAGSTFTDWSGGGCSGTGACAVTLSAATTITATFDAQALPTVTLTASTSGNGSGTITSVPAGISCGTSCAASFPSDTVVTLTAAPASGSDFSGWSGAGCSGTGACAVTLSEATTVTATFTRGVGERPAKATMQSPAPGSTLPGASVTFTWDSGTDVTEYWLQVSATPVGYELLSQPVAGLSQTVAGLPTDGRTLYVHLWSKIADTWHPAAYTYIAANDAAAKATMQSPAPGSTLSGRMVTFTWDSGTSVTAYRLDVGTTPGGRELFGWSVAGPSQLVAGLPIDGRTVYVSLWSKIAGIWLRADYTYTGTTTR
jgi:hypothetical protein